MWGGTSACDTMEILNTRGRHPAEVVQAPVNIKAALPSPFRTLAAIDEVQEYCYDLLQLSTNSNSKMDPMSFSNPSMKKTSHIWSFHAGHFSGWFKPPSTMPYERLSVSRRYSKPIRRRWTRSPLCRSTVGWISPPWSGTVSGGVEAVVVICVPCRRGLL